MRKKVGQTTSQRVTADQLGKAWGITRAAAKQMIERADAPRPDAAGKWDLTEANRYRAQRLELLAHRKRAEDLGPLDKAKLSKLELECERLRRAIARDERKTVEASEARACMNDIADLFVSALDSFAAQVAALTKDAALLKACEKLAGETRDSMAERIERQAQEWEQAVTISSETLQAESEPDDA